MACLKLLGCLLGLVPGVRHYLDLKDTVSKQQPAVTNSVQTRHGCFKVNNTEMMSAKFQMYSSNAQTRKSYFLNNRKCMGKLQIVAHSCGFCYLMKANQYIEDITRWREDMNFMFEWQEQYQHN